MTDKELNAHTFYGLSQEMYDEGYRLDFDNMKQKEIGETTRLSFPIICPDGTPLGIKGPIRIEGRMIQQITTSPITDNE
jgi:hypothetical protein